MSEKYQVETLLRPPVELWSVLAAVATACIVLLAPGLFLLPQPIAYVAAAVLLVWIAFPRYMQARRILRYQRNLRRLPTYLLRPDKIPVSTKTLFL
ncbi:MAG: conjugative coupling factor TraD, PFGI-1 class, partial [Pseudomonadota bacterium]